MGIYDEAEVCEVAGLYTLDLLRNRVPHLELGLYRDAGLIISRVSNGRALDRFRKYLTYILIGI